MGANTSVLCTGKALAIRAGYLAFFPRGHQYQSLAPPADMLPRVLFRNEDRIFEASNPRLPTIGHPPRRGLRHQRSRDDATGCGPESKVSDNLIQLRGNPSGRCQRG